MNPKGQQGLSSNPATRHYLTHDIFTYVNSIYKADDKGAYKTDTLKVGDTLFLASSMMVFEGFNRDAKREDYKPKIQTQNINQTWERVNKILNLK